MFYAYKSGGIVSRPLSDYRSDVLSGLSARSLDSFDFHQGPAVPLSDISGTLAQYADLSIYNTQSYRSGLGILSGAQTSQQDVPEGYVPHQNGPIYTWITNELGGNLDPQSNRVLVPAPSRLLFFNIVEESKSYSYHPAIIDLYTEVDFGSITQNVTSTSNNGLVADLNATQVEYGRVVHVGNLESFGFTRVIGAAEAAATNAWVGEGSLISFGRQTSPAVYGWITDGKVRSFTVHGTADVDYSPAIDGRGILPLQGNGGIVFVPNWNGSGTLRKLSGSSESITVNPDEKQMLFSFNGELIERTTDHYYGSGIFKNFSNAEEDKVFAWNGSGEIKVVSKKPLLYTLQEIGDWVLEDIKSRPLASIKYELSDEKHTENYNSSAIVEFTKRDFGSLSVCTTEESINGDVSGNATGCIVKIDATARVASGQTYQVAASVNTPTSTVDWGTITVPASMQQDWRYIYDGSNLMPQGGIKIDNFAGSIFQPNWVGRGGIKISGNAILPLFASVFGTGTISKIGGASITNFSLLQPGDGLYHIGGTAKQNFVPNWNGSGSLRKLGGSAESATWNPLERQMLFSFAGGITSEKHTESYVGSGRIRNFATLEAEKQSFDWVGSGKIKLRSDKPEQLNLKKLADTPLFDIRWRILSSLAWELSDEKHTECYNFSAFVPSVDLDYGLIVDTTQTPVTVLTTQTISSNTTGSSGVIQIDQGEVVTLGATYTVPNQITTPGTTLGYGLVSEVASPSDDYGWILGTHAHGIPYGAIEIGSTAATRFSPNWVGRGFIDVSGVARVPLYASEIGTGTIRALSGSAETSGKDVQGGGLFKIGSTAKQNFVPNWNGSGSLRKFSGAAESATWNPEEKQMLFSFIGTSGDPLITYGYAGDGSLWNFDGTVATTSFAWVGSGTLKLRTRIPEPTELANEKHTEVYDLNVCYDPPEIDYGLLVDASLASCVPVSGSITSNTIATSGCTQVVPGTTLSVASGITYNVPSVVSSPSSIYDYGFIYDPEDLVLDYGWILDDTGKECPFGTISTIRGSSGDPILTFSEVFTGDSAHWSGHGITITGEAEVTVPPQWDSPAEPPVKVYGASKTNFCLRTFGKGRMWSWGSGAESITFVPAGGQVLFKFVPGPLSRWDHYDWQPSWVSKGGIKIPTGESKTHWVPHIIGTGYIPVFNGAAESLTVNPEERQLLFSFTGEHQVSFTANPPEDTARVVFTGDAWPTRYVPHWTGSGTIPVTGIAKTHWVPHIIGTGFIPVLNGAAESLTVNPEEKQMLFSFIGERLSEKKSVTEIGSGDILLTGLSTQILTFSEQPFGTIPVSGIGHTTRTRPFIGFGSFRKLGGSAESATFNPLEKQMLFSFIGERISEKRTSSESGSGVLFGFGGASITTRSTYETQGLYRIYGESIIRFSLIHFGSGTLRKFGGGAESLTVNPDERQLLFSFTGEGSQSLSVAETKQVEIDITGKADPVLTTQAFHGSGTFSISGQGRVRWVPNNIGSGTIFTIAGASESLTFNPEEKQMLFSFIGEGSDSTTVREISKGGTLTFSGTSGDPLLTFAEQPFVQTKISGECRFTTHRNIVGTGSLYNLGGSAEAVGFNPEEKQILFSVTGESSSKLTKDYIGSGTFRKLGGSAESVSFNPDEKQLLFSFNGAGTQSTTTREIGTGTLSTTGEAGVLVRFAHTGEGTIPLSGSAHTTRARDYVGFGTVPTFSGAAESLTFNPTERDMLFSFFGERISEARTSRELSKGGTLAVRSTSGDPLLTFAEQPFVKIEIEGEGYLTRAFGYQGSGRISNVNNVDQAFARAPYIGSGTTRIRGTAFVQVIVWQPPNTQVWII